MKSIAFSKIEVQGELAYRSIINFARLEGKWYRPDEVFTADQHGWPGDWEGRLILALTLLGQSTHRCPAYLDKIISMLPKYLNEKGYFGKILPEGMVNEQQIAGHSWFLRGLAELYTWKKDEKLLGYINALIDNLLLKTKGVYARYPLTNDERFNCDIWELSQPQSKNKTHAHTIDTGCAFIMLDGASYVYELFKTPALKELVEEMIDRFVKIDLAEVKMQTHATLTATRGILRFYKTTGSKKYLEIAEGIFNFYKSNAWTENYSNYNWFGDPRWTEPCAIIDSFIVATWLWQYTQNPEYLEDAHHIYYNAICHGQRTQGEFGTDNCVGVKEPFIYPFTYEVYWCCSMRAGECFAKAIEFNYFLEGDTVFVPFYNDSIAKLDFEDGSCVIRQCSEYPYGSNNKFKIEESDIKTAKTFKFFVPSWINEKGLYVKLSNKEVASNIKNGFAEVVAKPEVGEIIEVNFAQKFYKRKLLNQNHIKGYCSFRHGPLILAVSTDEEIFFNGSCDFEYTDTATYKNKASGVFLTPLNDIKNLTGKESKKQILFRD